MRRLALGTLVSVMMMAALSTQASAGLLWCRSDPVIRLDGTVVDIVIAIPVDYVPAVNGATHFDVRTAKGATRELILNDVGYNGHGSEVVFTDGPGWVKDKQIPTSVRVHVPIDETMLAPGETVPVEVTVTPANGEQLVVVGTSELTTVDLTVLGQ